MFKKKDKKKPEENELSSKVDQDLVVHNMPKGGGLGGKKIAEKNYNSSASNNNEDSSHKMVGILIIVFGVILVAALIWLSYRFIINPQSNNQPAVNNQEQTSNQNGDQNQEEDFENEEQVSATTTPVSEADNDSADFNEDDEVAATSTEDNANNNQDSSEEDEDYDFVPILDSDNDGLTDEEEAALGTNPNNEDSDSDGYDDLSEINNGYNPLGDGVLTDGDIFTRYFSPVEDYSLIYPSSWDLNTLNNGYTTVITASDNSLIQVSVQPNSKLQSITSWYEETFSEDDVSEDLVREGKGWEGIWGENNLNFYLTDDNRQNIYVISYIPVIKSRLTFSTIFEIAVNSLEIE